MKQTDIYTEALTCLRSILLADHAVCGGAAGAHSAGLLKRIRQEEETK